MKKRSIFLLVIMFFLYFQKQIYASGLKRIKRVYSTGSLYPDQCKRESSIPDPLIVPFVTKQKKSQRQLKNRGELFELAQAILSSKNFYQKEEQLKTLFSKIADLPSKQSQLNILESFYNKARLSYSQISMHALKEIQDKIKEIKKS